MSAQDFQYDVAFSFVAQDEGLATQLADQFEGRLRVFLYSRKQEQLAGTDGDKSFNDVFASQSRLVVYRRSRSFSDSASSRSTCRCAAKVARLIAALVAVRSLAAAVITRGNALDAMLRTALPPPARGVTRGGHDYFNRIDVERQQKAARALNAA